jgi:thiol:disulfide interchange protein/DsbC/DsbD-like thiol-disulfide interchange protein
MLRALLFFFLATGAVARASEAIPAPPPGVSAQVTQPHVTAELIPETTQIRIGQPFLIALHLHMDPGWHTYWINFGDAGLPTTIKWTLPPGFTAGPIQWPTPEVHAMGPETTYGYGGDVYLLTTITPPAKLGAKLPRQLDFKARADWLVCQEECIPGKGDLAVTLNFDPAAPPSSDAAAEAFFATAKSRLPVPNTLWDVKAGYAPRGGLVSGPGQVVLLMQLKNRPGVDALALGKVYFFPEQENVISPKEDDLGKPDPAQKASEFVLPFALQQNGEKPPEISGVLVSDQPLAGEAKAIYIPAVSTAANDIPVNWAALTAPPGDSAAAATPAASSSQTGGGSTAKVKDQAPPFLIAVLGAAFLGGLILNLMPCVLPVLSLKVFSLVRHAGGHPGMAWRQGVAFTAGVVISFWILAGLLIALRAAGNHLGWGFQMQSPGFVLALIFLFFLLGLNLFGVFELGASLVGLDAKATGRVGNGLTSSFLNGALATLAATPCTAPFMGSSIGFAAEQPPAVALLIFTFLALGMATPYLLLTTFPGALRFVPKPGAWMEAFKQFMGFLLLATVIFLVYVFGALVGQDQVLYLLAALLIAGVAAWIYGRWAAPGHTVGVRLAAVVLALLCLAYAVNWGVVLSRATPTTGATAWQPWTPSAVDAALAQQRPVFVDFTAAWCLSCKVNEQVALETDPVRQAFAKKNVALFRADWTHADPAISAVLMQYHRDGVPLYLLYSPKAKDAPQVLPEVLTPGLVLQAIDGV